MDKLEAMRCVQAGGQHQPVGTSRCAPVGRAAGTVAYSAPIVMLSGCLVKSLVRRLILFSRQDDVLKKYCNPFTGASENFVLGLCLTMVTAGSSLLTPVLPPANPLVPHIAQSIDECIYVRQDRC